MTTQAPGRRGGLHRAGKLPLKALDAVGEQASFYFRAYGHAPRVLRRYRKEVLRLLAEVSFLTAFAGIELGLQGYSQLNTLGVEALSGFVSAYLNTRLAAPVIAGIALVATVGAGFTAQLGAQRVSEEIDALEVMAVPSVPFLVTTRIIAGLIAVVPLYAVALLSSFAATRLIITVVYHQSAGAYQHYFATFLIPSDLYASFIKVVIMAVVVISIHCYYGYNASGGPAGVGRAVGRAVRLSLVAVLLTDLLLSLALYANANTLHISG
jgi:phospholipid/cholesterol/gamma-HCH transport system permease protein